MLNITTNKEFRSDVPFCLWQGSVSSPYVGILNEKMKIPNVLLAEEAVPSLGQAEVAGLLSRSSLPFPA